MTRTSHPSQPAHAAAGPATQPAAPVVPSRGALRPLALGDVRITGGFWAERQAVNGAATLQHCVSWLTRLGWLGNFERAAAGEGGHEGREFSDSEIYKVLEALAWESARVGADGTDDASWAEQAYQRISATVVAAQRPDGYLNTMFGGPGQRPRYSDLEWGHELYCAGHLIQAAVARLRTRGGDAFVDAAVRLADHVVAEFGPDGREAVCGHPEIEVALAELGRATGDRRYLDQARLFVQRRGRGLLADQEIGAAYFQDDVPVLEAQVLRGHAVRALYLSAGAADVADEFADEGLLDALRTQWATTVARRTYLTGGMGSRHEGEAFGDDFELPSDRAYSETCAGVGSVMLSWRLLLAEGEARYADLIERTLYNVVATSPDQSGTAFFYVNPLQRSTAGIEAASDRPSPRAASSQRAAWFDVSCCPTNVARTLASLSAYVATVDDSGLQLHQYAPAEIRTTLPDGTAVELSVTTDYPVDGRVTVTVGDDAEREWTLSLRVPRWAAGASATSNGEPVETPVGEAPGGVGTPSYLQVTRRFRRGDVVELMLPVRPRWTRPDHRIDDLRGTVAVERGPLVLCAESVDVDVHIDGNLDLLNLQVRTSEPPVDEGLGAVVRARFVHGPVGDWAYPTAAAARSSGAHRPNGAGTAPADDTSLRLVPYAHWAQRGPSTMRVWMPEDAGDRARSQ